MKENIESISAIWKDGQKSVAECAELIYDFLQLLKNHNPYLFGKWYKKSSSKGKAIDETIEISQEYLYQIVEKKWDKKFPHLGCRVSFWNGIEEEGLASDISFNLGAYGAKPHIKSSCVIRLPYQGKQFEFYSEQSNQQKLIKLMENYWHPDKLLINGEIHKRK